MILRTLAHGPIARVEREPDGRLVVTVGPVSVRLTASAAASLSRTLVDALQVLELDAPATNGRCQQPYGA